MPEATPMSMFCGLPVRVAVEPMLLAVARASRYGVARTPRAALTSRTSGVRARHTVSLTKTAESRPATATRPASRRRGEAARRATTAATQRKNPASRRWPTITIVPNSSTSVPRSTIP